MQDVEGVFAQRLRETREAAGLSQVRLAEALASRTGLELDPTAITRIERGQRGIALREAYALAETLGVSLAYLCRMPSGTKMDDLRASIEAARREEHAASAAVRAEHARMTEARIRAEALEKRLAAEQAAADGTAPPKPASTVRFRDFRDAGTVAAAFDNGRVVNLDLELADDVTAARVSDFALGLVRDGLRGSVERVNERWLRLNPHGYGVAESAKVPPEEDA